MQDGKMLVCGTNAFNPKCDYMVNTFAQGHKHIVPLKCVLYLFKSVVMANKGQSVTFHNIELYLQLMVTLLERIRSFINMHVFQDKVKRKVINLCSFVSLLQVNHVTTVC